MPEATPMDESSGLPRDRDARGGEPLLRLLTWLIDGLDVMRSDDPPDGRYGPALDRWEDEDYVYLEAVLDAPSDAEIDISTQGSRVFIRMGR
jgi:hypothetical protein